MVYKVTIKNVIESITKNKRLDGRTALDMRNIEVKFGVSNKAEGSVMVTCGKTQVACGIKMGVATPYTDHEDEGTMMTSLELLPLSSPVFEYGQPSIESVEISRIVDRGIRESGFIDFKKLCIKEGEKVWSVFIDLATINDDGSLIDVCALAATLALLTARMPVYDEEKEVISYGEFTDKKLPLDIDKMPLTTTFFKIGDKIFTDPTREEDDAAEGRLTLEVSKPGKEEMINAMQKGGNATFTIEEVEMMIDEAVKGYKRIRTIIDDSIEKFDKDSKGKKKKE